MAKAPMKNTLETVSGNVEILYKSDYEGEAVTLDTAAFPDGVCKAGTPMTRDGQKATGAEDVFGILLSDVYEDRPQGTVVYMGTINESIANTHSGVTIDTAMKAAMPRITFMKEEEK